jgi:hypothetical protein
MYGTPKLWLTLLLYFEILTENYARPASPRQITGRGEKWATCRYQNLVEPKPSALNEMQFFSYQCHGTIAAMMSSIVKALTTLRRSAMWRQSAAPRYWPITAADADSRTTKVVKRGFCDRLHRPAPHDAANRPTHNLPVSMSS